MIAAADWRFLLPMPEGGRFARLVLLGAPDDLQDHITGICPADEVTTRLPDDGSASAVVVLPGARVTALELARATAGGGSVYVQGRWGARHPLGGTARSVAGALSREGLTPTGVYALGMHAGLPSRFVPIDEPGALQWFLRHLYRPLDVAGWLAASTGTAAAGVAARLLRAVSPQFAVTAVASRARCAAPRALSMIASRHGPGLATARPLLLAGGGDRVVALPFPRGHSRPSLVLKLPRLRALAARTEAEHGRAAALRASLPAALADAIPRPMELGRTGDDVFSIEEYVDGRPLLVTSGSWGAPARGRESDLRDAAEWLERFHLATLRERRPWGDAETGEWVEEPFDRFHRALGATDADRRLRDAALEHARSVHGAMLPIVCRHRDYTVWNVMRSRSGLAVIDWEGARPGPALCDLLHLATSWHVAVNGMSYPRGEARAVRELFLSPRPADPHRTFVDAIVDRYLSRLGMDGRLTPILLLYHCLELALRRIEQLRDHGEAPSDARQVNPARALIQLLADRRTELLRDRTSPHVAPTSG